MNEREEGPHMTFSIADIRPYRIEKNDTISKNFTFRRARCHVLSERGIITTIRSLDISRLSPFEFYTISTECLILLQPCEILHFSSI